MIRERDGGSDKGGGWREGEEKRERDKGREGKAEGQREGKGSSNAHFWTCTLYVIVWNVNH